MFSLKYFRVLVLIGVAFGLASCAHPGPRTTPAVLSQTSTISALLEGSYDGVVSCGELRRQGNFGIGTFDHLDGELILLDGVVYQAKADGKVVRAPDALSVPFAAVTRFASRPAQKVGAAASYEALQKHLDTLRSGDNVFCAIRVDGVFDYVKYRSVPPQTKPYPKLIVVTANHQAVFERRAIRGTLVGFWCPPYSNSFNVPGYHLHFISEDRQSAGHLLDCSWQGGTAGAKAISEFHVSLPRTADFQTLNLRDPSSRTIRVVESGK